MLAPLLLLVTLFAAQPAAASLERTAAPELAAAAQLANAPLLERTLMLEEAPASEIRFELFEGNELAAAASESSSAPGFHPLAAVSLLSKDGAEAPLVSADELRFQKTRIGVFDFLGTNLIGVQTGVTLNLQWGCGDFGCRFSEGIGIWLSEDPLGDRDSVNLYGFVGMRPHEKTDPLGLEGGPSTPQVGWLYKVEGELAGVRVSYVGSTVQELRARFSRHQWEQLMQAGTTRIERTPVFGQPNVAASRSGTLRGAQSEVVRGPEQRLLDNTRAEMEQANGELSPGGRPGRVLNKINAAREPGTLIERHGVTTGKAETVKVPGGGWLLPGLFFLQIGVDSYSNAMAQKEARYGMAPYGLMDEGGEFTVSEKENCLVCRNQFYKVYASGSRSGQQVEISRDEAMKLKREGEALWGTLDWKRDFVPGVLNRELPASPAERIY